MKDSLPAFDFSFLINIFLAVIGIWIGNLIYNEIKRHFFSRFIGKRYKYSLIDEQIRELEKEFPYGSTVYFFDWDPVNKVQVFKPARVHHYGVLNPEYVNNVQAVILDNGIYHYRTIHDLRIGAGEKRRQDAKKEIE
jgi:hypothetical protein